jgi:hypothetical protein
MVMGSALEVLVKFGHPFGPVRENSAAVIRFDSVCGSFCNRHCDAKNTRSCGQTCGHNQSSTTSRRLSDFAEFAEV